MMHAAGLFILLVLVAGCTDPAGPAGTRLSTSPGSTSDEPEPTAEPVVPGVDPSLPMGTIKGRVLDDEQIPLPNITVALIGFNVSAFTNDRGEFAFNDVNAGEYFLVAKGPGHREKQLGVQVREAEVTEVSFILESIPVPVPRIEGPFLYRKSINCARAVKAPTGEEEFAVQGVGFEPPLLRTSAMFASDPCPFNTVLGEEWTRNSTGEVLTTPGLVGVLFEAEWTKTTDGSEALELNASLLPVAAKSGFDVIGVSPLHTVKNLAALQEARAAFPKANDYGANAGKIKYALDVAPSMTGQAVDVGFALDQNVNLAITLFYVNEPVDYAKHYQYK